MNRRDTALIAHLDAIDTRWTQLFATVITRLDRIGQDIADIKADIAGMKVEQSMHRHEDDQ